MHFSVTERGNFKRCNRQWRFSSKNGMHLGPIVAPVYLSVGTLIHRGAQTWMLDVARAMNYEQHVLKASIEMVNKANARYLKQVGVGMSTDQIQILEDSVHFAREMSKNYEIRWGGPIPEGFKIVRPEQRAVIPVPGTEHKCPNCAGTGRINRIVQFSAYSLLCETCNGTGVQLHALDMRWDGLMVDEQDRLHILEHKTYDNRPSELSLKANDQFLAYTWGAEQLGVGEVVGIAYDGLWRRDKIPRGKSFEDLNMRLTIPQQRARLAEFAHLLPIELNKMYAETFTQLEDLTFDRTWKGCYDCKAFEPACWALSRGEMDVYNTYLRTHLTERSDDIEEELEDADDAA